MAVRHFPDWISAYLELTEGTEAPEAFHIWTAVSTIAGALRRRVWIDMLAFQWVCNFYTIFVAKPGIVTKSTAIGIGMNLLKEASHRTSGIHFGPESTTWQALLQSLESAGETVDYLDHDGKSRQIQTASLMVQASELGTFMKTDDGAMGNVLIDLWDGKRSQQHSTKSNGETFIPNPLLNILGATTPSWISANFKENDIQGGFASRVVFVYAEEKRHFIAFPDEITQPKRYYELQEKLASDLASIAEMKGPFTISNEVREWGRPWYARQWEKNFVEHHMASARFDGYKARKWTLLFKLAMIHSASRGNDMTIKMVDINRSLALLERAESFMLKVFESVAMTPEAKNIAELIPFLRTYGYLKAAELYGKVQNVMSSDHFRAAVQRGVDNKTFTIRHLEGGSVLTLTSPSEHLSGRMGRASEGLG